jgi:L-arabinose isomerase
VAVTEVDKVEAELKFGFSVNTYGIGDVVKIINEISDREIDKLTAEYEERYAVVSALRKGGEKYDSLREAAKIELGLKAFLEEGNFKGFTDTFEDLHGMVQLPGIAAQRLMGQGYGFGGEGDWKTAAMNRIVKVMSKGRPGGTSFMEDYTYNFGAVDQVLGAHMLEICPSIAEGKPRVEVHTHTIGRRNDIARLLFSGKPGPALNISCIDMGNRFRILVNKVETVRPPQDMPKLPVAKALWEPKPNLAIAGAAWIHAGGAHHSVYTQGISIDQVEDYAEMAGVELIVIDENTNIRELKSELRHNAAYYQLKAGV